MSAPTNSIALALERPSNEHESHSNEPTSLVKVPMHPMITRSQKGVFKPNPKYALTSDVAEITEPKSVKEALAHPG